MCIPGDIGDKFYVVKSGKVLIELPDPEIPFQEFKMKYAEYKLLVEQIKAGEELERKKLLVVERVKDINKLLEEK